MCMFLPWRSPFKLILLLDTYPDNSTETYVDNNYNPELLKKWFTCEKS